jgi:tetratricopeptide (TPR) repeat protein
VRNEEIVKVEEYLKRALALAPGNQWFQLRTAEIYMRKEDFTDARRIAQKVFQTAPNEEIRIYSQNRINLINSLEAQLLGIRNYDDRLRNDFPDRILSDEEFARLRELAILESINKGLRKPRTEEIRVLGYLTKIECGEKGIEYFVRVDKKILKLRSKDFENITLVSFAKEMSNAQIGCETIKNETLAVITYYPNNNPAGVAGEILSIEFVPQNFKFLK